MQTIIIISGMNGKFIRFACLASRLVVVYYAHL
jgi:hypothetical protein